jgi:hypothetical protein
LKTSGVYRAKIAADITALKAVTGMADSDFRYVLGVGFYFFDATTTPVGDTLPGIIKPGAGAGQWYHELLGLLGTTSGIATIGSDNKVVQPSKNQVLGIYENTLVIGASSSIQYSQSSASYIAVGTAQGYVDVPSAANGDVLIARARFCFTASAGGATSKARLEVADNVSGSPTVNTHLESEVVTEKAYDSAAPFYAEPFIRHPVTVNGTSRVRLALQCNGADSAQVRAPHRNPSHPLPALRLINAWQVELASLGTSLRGRRDDHARRRRREVHQR